MLYEVYKLGTKDVYKKVECKNPKEAICLALQMKSNQLNMFKVEPYEANFCVKSVNGKRNTVNYYNITFNSVLMDARDYGYDLNRYEIKIRSSVYTYSCWVTLDRSFEMWSCNVVGYTSNLLVNKEMGLIIESANSMEPFKSNAVLGMSDFEKCVERFKQTGKFGLRCRRHDGYYTIACKNERFDVEI